MLDKKNGSFEQEAEVHLGIIACSMRKESNSEQVAKRIQQIAEQQNNWLDKPYLLDLSQKPLPLFDESAWDIESPTAKAWAPIEQELDKCDAFIFVVPEWGGMAPAAIKNLFLYCNKKNLAHKPTLLVSVTSGIAGQNPIQELRISSYKNTRINYIPEQVILRFVETFLENFDAPKTETVKELKARLTYAISLLQAYAQALQGLRRSGVIDLDKYPNGH